MSVSSAKPNQKIMNSKTKVLMSLKEIKSLKDKTEKNRSLNDLISHILTNNCVDCHNVTEIIDYLTTNLVHFINCEKSIDVLIEKFAINESTSNELIKNYYQLIAVYVNIKPIKCVHILDKVLLKKLYGFSSMCGDDHEIELTPQEMYLFDRIHATLKQIKITKFNAILMESLRRMFPSRYKCDVRSLSCYIHNLLDVYEYTDDKWAILSLIFDKLLWFDALCTPDKLSADQEVFAIEDCNPKIDEQSAAKHIPLLNCSVKVILEFIDRKFMSENTEQIAELFQLFQTVFCNIILTTEGSHNLAYILFYMCSKSESLCDEFIQTLWKLALNNNIPLQTREKAVYYINSLLINGKFITTSDILCYMETSTVWIHSYIDANDKVKDEFNAEDAIFYLVCQSLFNIFCAFHADFDQLSLRYIKGMNFQRILKCKLCPQKACSRSIGAKFIYLATHYQIAYCTQDRNDSQNFSNRFPETHLFSFHAFDKYLLPILTNKIEPIYRHIENDENNSRDRRMSCRDITSEDSDYGMNQSLKQTETMWQNMLTDSSPSNSYYNNEHMDWGSC